MCKKKSICNRTSISIRDKKGAVFLLLLDLILKICLWYSMIESLGEFLSCFGCLNFEYDG